MQAEFHVGVEKIAMTARQSFRVGVVLAVVHLAVVGSPRVALAASTVYVAGQGNEFGTLSLTTGAFTSIGTLNLPTGEQIFGMGFGSDGKLYGLDSELPDAHLFLIDTSTANVTDLGAIGQSAIGAGADASGKFYAFTQDPNVRFYTLSPPSNSTSVVGPIGIGSAGLAAVNAAGTQLFTSVSSSSAPGYDLYNIHVTTAAATLVGNIGFEVINGLFVSGTLYGFDFGSDAIVTIDTATGAGTQVATYSLPNGDPIFASATPAGQIGPVPEPSTLALAITALGGVGLLLSCRRRRPAA
jgi:hypothetical protein